MTTTSSRSELLSELAILPMEHAATPLHLNALETERVSLTDSQSICDLLELTGMNDAPAELHLLLLALFAVRNQGSLCLPLDALASEASPLCGHADLDHMLATAQCALEAGHYAPLIGTNAEAPIIYRAGNLYFQRYHSHERALEARLLELCNAPSPGIPADCDLLALTRTCSRYDSFALNNEQRWGVYLACRNHYSIISGGPGTGKTTLVASLLRALWRLGACDPTRIKLIAPTGRAAQRLGDSLRSALAHANEETELVTALRTIEGSTIHRLLRYSPRHHAFRHNSKNPIDADVVICDEVSMIDVVLMDQLLAAIPPHARVVFLGDRDQLPSVEAGAVLSGLIPRDERPTYSPTVAQDLQALAEGTCPVPEGSTEPSVLRDHIILLKQSHRTRGAVSALAERINAGDTAAIAAIPPIDEGVTSWSLTGSECVRLTSLHRPEEVATSWCQQLFCTEPTSSGDTYATAIQLPIAITEEGLAADPARCKTLFDALQRGQILTLGRHGPTGCVTLNRGITRHMRRSLAPHASPQEPLFPGLPIMINQNDRVRALFNGDIGIILRHVNDQLVALFPRSNGAYAAIPIHQLPRHTAAFAITIHKSQGSEYGNVLMFLPAETTNRLLTRELLYTGITRSKGNVYLHASPEVLAQATHHRITRYQSRMWCSQPAR